MVWLALGRLLPNNNYISNSNMMDETNPAAAPMEPVATPAEPAAVPEAPATPAAPTATVA